MIVSRTRIDVSARSLPVHVPALLPGEDHREERRNWRIGGALPDDL